MSTALTDPTQTSAWHPGEIERNARANTLETTQLKSDVDERARDIAGTLVADLCGASTEQGGLDRFGAASQARAASRSKMLEAPIRTLAGRGEDGGDVAVALTKLKMEVEKLDPGKVDFEAGWITRLIGKIPGIGTPMKRYFTRFESAQTVIDAIERSLVEGGEQLRRDNVTLSDDRQQLRESTVDLERDIALGEAIDLRLSAHAERADNPTRARIENELIFALRQRTIDLAQQLAVARQGVVAIELVRANNTQLMRGVSRARNVTMNALTVAVTVAKALANQKIVLDGVSALNETTSSPIASTAERLKTQGAEIHRQAAMQTLDMDALKSAFSDIHEAMNAVESHRREALPVMAETISVLTTMSRE